MFVAASVLFKQHGGNKIGFWWTSRSSP